MSDEVSDFLRSVELLKGRREEEDEARSRELEEKILQEKKERQARRAERARSISPQKSSPANTPSPTAHRIGLPLAADGTSLPSPGLESTGSPRPRAAPPSDAMESATDYSGSPTKENESPFDSDTKRTSLTMTSPSIGMPSARSPLSWQRRPTSQASERPRSRTLTMVAAENAARSNSPNPADSAPAAEQTLSRDQIAQSLAGKDPSWFRQTADPGRGSATFRKSQVEDQDTVDVSSIRTQLPGMSRDSSIEPSKESSSRPQTPNPVPTKLGSPLPLTGSQRLDPPAGDNTGDLETPTANRQSVISSGGRTSPTRPVSPTKGMGGFVQSAMMKRSDSVKRWSVNSAGGLQRPESTQGSQRGSPPKAGSRPASMLRGSSDAPVLRPTSSQGNEKEAEAETEPAAAGATTPSETKTKGEDENTTPPSSPSKTMDPRRWSPNKNSSWLEAALNKPESPKAKPAPPAVNQPAWMVELNKAKAQKASTELARSASLPTKKPEVKTGGLMRSTPMGANIKPSALTGFPVVPPVTTTDKPAIGGFRNNLKKASPTTEGPESEGHEEPTVTAKTKPETPPKKDFRANLKPRVPVHEAKSTEPVDELKNVFGTLRRTKTQNYVAPDELKDNILRGKAALNATGGPKKTERKDEFKEAILKKKEDFKKAQQEGRGITREPSSASEKTIPEGIAKKLEIQRTGTLSKQSPTTPDFPLQTPTLTGSNRSSSVSTISKRDLPDVGSQTGLEHSPGIPNDPVAKPAPPVTLPKQSDAPGRVQSRVGGLAERFNPALAGLIARGPPPASGPSKSPGTSDTAGSSTAETGKSAGPGPQLTHLTKNRARGPRRKAPTSVAKPAEEEKLVEAVSEPEKKPIALPKPENFVVSPKLDELVKISGEEKPITATKTERFSTQKAEALSSLDTKKSVVEDKPKALGDVISLIDSSKRVPKEEPVSVGQPISLVGSTVKTRPRSPTKVHEQVAALAALSQQSPKPAEQSGEASQPSSPKKLDMKRMSRFMDEQNQTSPKPEPVKSRPSSPVKDRFPALASPSPAKQPANDPVELKPALPVKSGLFGGVGLGLSQPTTARNPVVGAEKPPQVPPKGARPLPPPPAMASPPAVASPRIPSPVRSPGKQSSDVSALLNDFFGPERPKRKYTADAAEILMRRPASTATVQTQRSQLFQLSAEGKKIPVPTHHERVLFEREMYVCPHTFIDGAGKKVSEVYFWAGDEVPESVVDDAHLFAAREARAFGGKLVKLSQGKETSEFLQALGGIVIVRRGSSNKYDSLAPNMLCGRRYLGQVAFDEVDFSPLSLCSGFPYLISQQGKCYLWKGKGSDVEELGCARLVGMDLALMGELLEVEEGNEPKSFWQDVFGGGSRPSSADHWRLKPNYDKYSGRLFCADAGEKHQITEISPFNQTDLLPSKIYVLDAFFEMYIIVGARSQHQYAAFRNALDFAQEYAILAAGMEDRPFVPISTVVLEGIPRDLKSVFRKWRDAGSPTVMNVSPANSSAATPAPGGSSGASGSPLKRARSLRVVPLTQAMQALALE
ncbi:hypothetical protein MFIFM68171_10291 [Madurella fahalii]|uniref:Gelsolin n=1 Tax=Madurella fahalii TaxID=1157608 RepID=A0ABQ0GQS4_9PEZI